MGRGFRGLTAIPVHAAAGRNRERSEAAQRSAGRLREGFLAREECRVAKRPGRGRNLTDPLKTRLPYGKGRFSAGLRAPAHPYATDRISLPCYAAPSPPSRPAASGGQERLGVFRRELGSQMHSEPVGSEPEQVLVEVAELRGKHER